MIGFFSALARMFSTWGTEPSSEPAQDETEGPGNWPLSFDGGLVGIPTGRRAVYAVYGNPKPKHDKRGRVSVSGKWKRSSMMLARHLPGIPRGKLYVHKLMEPYLREALRRAAIAAPEYVIKKIGCFNPRHSRHDVRRPLSYHTWGIAVDINPDENKPNTAGDMPPEFVEAFESVGFEWGGRWSSFPDAMHFQLVKSK